MSHTHTHTHTHARTHARTHSFTRTHARTGGERLSTGSSNWQKPSSFLQLSRQHLFSVTTVLSSLIQKCKCMHPGSVFFTRKAVVAVPLLKCQCYCFPSFVLHVHIFRGSIIHLVFGETCNYFVSVLKCMHVYL